MSDTKLALDLLPVRRTRIPLALFTIASTSFFGGCGHNPATAPADTEPMAALAGRHHDGDLVPTVVSARGIPVLPNRVLATIGGVNVYNGGYGSAIDQRLGRPDEFYSLTDRGPNVSGSGSDKLFAVPDFHPQIGRFHFERGALVRDEVITLKDAAGNPLTGLPIGASGCGTTGEVPKAIDGSPLPFDPNGIDSEGLRVMPDGSFWVSDEYGPFLTHFDRWGRTIERNSPCSGSHPLPAVLTKRQANKGMEGLASILGGRVLVGIVQNPLDNPNHAAAKTSRLLRIVFLDVRTGQTKQFAYLMDDVSYGASEIEAISPTRFLVDERDGKFFNDPASPAVQKKIYLIDISDPSNGTNGRVIDGSTLEQMNDSALAAHGIVPVKKTLVVDMLAFGYPHDKAEGMVLIDGGRTIAVSNDDDFGVTDDGNQHLIQKLLPSGMTDHNEVWFFRLSRSLYEVH